MEKRKGEIVTLYRITKCLAQSEKVGSNCFVNFISVKKMLSQDLIKNLFPIHDTEFLKKMGAEWYGKPFAQQPIGEYTKASTVSAALCNVPEYLTSTYEFLCKSLTAYPK